MELGDEYRKLKMRHLVRSSAISPAIIKELFVPQKVRAVRQGCRRNIRTLVTVVSHLQLLWNGFTQGGVVPIFPSGADPYLCRREGYCTSYATLPHSRTRFSVQPMREGLPGTISKLGKGADPQRGRMGWKGEGNEDGVRYVPSGKGRVDSGSG